MRILLLWDYYEPYLDDFHARYPETTSATYSQAHQVLAGDFFGWPSYLVPQFRSMGHEAELIVANGQVLQQAWARENGFAWDPQHWRFTVAAEQVRRFRPDVLWIIGAEHYCGPFLQELRAACGCVIAWRAGGWPPHLDLSSVHAVLSSNLAFVDRFRRLGVRSEFALPCFDSRILELVPPGERHVDLSFVGSLSPLYFRRRMLILDYIQRRFPLEIYAERIAWRRRPLPLRAFLGQLRFAPFQFRARRQTAVYGRRLFEVLGASHMTLNVHRDGTVGFDFSIRLFEATGSGAMLLTESSPSLSRILQPDREAATFGSREEALEKLRYFRDHPEERRAIAAAGQRRTLRFHNSRVRAEEFVDVFRAVGAGR